MARTSPFDPDLNSAVVVAMSAVCGRLDVVRCRVDRRLPLLTQAVRKLKNSKRDENNILKFDSKPNGLAVWTPKAVLNE